MIDAPSPRILFCLVLLCPVLATAQLAVTVSPVKIAGQKAVVTLTLTNQLAEKVEAARAVCFLLDDQGRMVGQSTRWVIGGTKEQPALEPKKATTFNFVVTSPQPFTATNLTAKISFSRVVLAGEGRVFAGWPATFRRQACRVETATPAWVAYSLSVNAVVRQESRIFSRWRADECWRRTNEVCITTL